ncbi:MAG: AMIN domain-containing protein [Myxococcales bacterium]|nr:AMIN domain-containing protein [Myxococcales bacterium]
MRPLMFVAALVALAAGPALGKPAADAPEGQAAKRRVPYLGVSPGTNDYLPRTRQRRGSRVVTWVGFQMVGEGGRVFIQANEPPLYNLVPGAPDEIILDLSDSKLRTRNDGRPLETGWFPTAVERIDAQQLPGHTTRIIVKLREVVGYDLRQEGNYLLLDFRRPTQPITPPAYPPEG